MGEQYRVGVDCVESVTELLQRIRQADVSAGVYDAAELQFWWSRPRRSDGLDQLFWFDEEGRPEAAVVIVDFGGAGSILYHEVTFCPFVLPGSSPDRIAAVLDRGLEHARSNGFEAVELEVERSDEVMKGLLIDRGFEIKEANMLVECRMSADARPEIGGMAEGYRLASRSETTSLMPHHMSGETGAAFEERLQQLSLYRPDLDLVVLDPHDDPAGYGMFWYDPTTHMGVVEPMRTYDDHQQKGVARHILTTGVNRLFDAGAQQIAIGYEPENPASGHLYRGVGFEPVGSTDLWSGPTTQDSR